MQIFCPKCNGELGTADDGLIGCYGCGQHWELQFIPREIGD